MSFEACGPKLAGLLEDLLWSSHLDNPSLLQAIDPVTVLDRGQSVDDDDHGLLALETAVGCSPLSIGGEIANQYKAYVAQFEIG